MNALLPLHNLSTRERLILTGLYLSKFDILGVKQLGFETFTEAFNVIGYALGGRPASIKNYRDEFDPLFPNSRQGWHKRRTREFCRRILEEYKEVPLDEFSSLIKSFAGYLPAEPDEADRPVEGDASLFAKRLVTGLAAEHYFETVYPRLPPFTDYTAENTTMLGCGYDFRLRSPNQGDYLAIEVKGLSAETGNISLTAKEHAVAEHLRGRYFLFVVTNFRELPGHQIFQDPLFGPLSFERKERVLIQVAWTTNL